MSRVQPGLCVVPGRRPRGFGGRRWAGVEEGSGLGPWLLGSSVGWSAAASGYPSYTM